MGKSSINGPFSMAMLNNGSLNITKSWTLRCVRSDLHLGGDLSDAINQLLPRMDWGWIGVEFSRDIPGLEKGKHGFEPSKCCATSRFSCICSLQTNISMEWIW